MRSELKESLKNSTGMKWNQGLDIIRNNYICHTKEIQNEDTSYIDSHLLNLLDKRNKLSKNGKEITLTEALIKLPKKTQKKPTNT